MDVEQRIAQFEKMAREDAENEMAWFSLGGAYNAAGRFADAADAYRKCVEVNPDMSKAYQLAGAAYLAASQDGMAKDILLAGYTKAAERGDLMPKNAIAELLGDMGVALPEVESKAAPPIPEGSFIDAKTGRPGTQMPRPPFKGPVGAWIHENISKETFDEWIGQGTKVINELRLDLSRDADAETYDQHMREFLGIDEKLLERLEAEHAR